jgi:hypothetical protein
MPYELAQALRRNEKALAPACATHGAGAGAKYFAFGKQFRMQQPNL